MTNTFTTRLGLVLLGGTLLMGTAQAQTILSGPAGGFYDASCKAYTSADSFGGPTCENSNGTMANLAKVLNNPTLVAYGQLNVIATAMQEDPGLKDKIAVLRDDVGVECMYLAARTEKQLTLDVIRKNAAVATFVVVKGSGTAVTLDAMRAIDADKLGKAAVKEVENFDAAVAALTDPTLRNVVVPIMQVPDPEVPNFKKLSNAGAKFVGLSNRRMTATQIDGKPVYTLGQNTPILGSVLVDGKVTTPALSTTCTQVVLFSGKGNGVNTALANELKTADADAFLPSRKGAQADKAVPSSKADKPAGSTLTGMAGSIGEFLKRARDAGQRGLESAVEGWKDGANK